MVHCTAVNTRFLFIIFHEGIGKYWFSVMELIRIRKKVLESFGSVSCS